MSSLVLPFKMVWAPSVDMKLEWNNQFSIGIGHDCYIPELKANLCCYPWTLGWQQKKWREKCWTFHFCGR
jgi:hypothetical protein